MKKILVGLLIFLVLVIGFGLSANLNGEFTKWAHSSVKKDHFVDGGAMYLGYYMNWNGIGFPVLEKIDFIKKDGTVLTNDDHTRQIEPYIASMTTEIGALDEETVMNEGLHGTLLNIKDYQVNEGFYLVLRVDLENTTEDIDIETIKISYKKYGVTQTQTLPFDDGVITEHE